MRPRDRDRTKKWRMRRKMTLSNLMDGDGIVERLNLVKEDC